MKAPEYNGVITDGDQVYLVGGAYGNFRVTTNFLFIETFTFMCGVICYRKFL